MGVLEKSFPIVYKGNALCEREAPTRVVFYLQIAFK